MKELQPKNSQKSFYGKAKVEERNGCVTLYSYGTAIASKLPDGTIKRLWKDWTATTGRHIAAFCGLNKSAFMALPYEGC